MGVNAPPWIGSGAAPGLAGFAGCHRGETILVCGCGSSLSTLRDSGRCVTIGVNDVGRLFDPTYLVALNPRQQFTGDRFRYVEESRARAVFTQLDLGLRHPYVVRFRLGPYGGTELIDPEALPHTRNSPYVALCLALYMGAARIGLIGVDFTDHHFFAATGRHPLTRQLAQIDREYARFAGAWAGRGVEIVNLSAESRLTALPKRPLKDFLGGAAPEPWVRPLKILSYATTPVAGVPAILARCISARTPHEAECIWATNDYGNGVCFEGGTSWRAQPEAVRQKLAEADLVIVHNGKVDEAHRAALTSRPVITMAHNYLWNVDTQFVRAGQPGIVVGQYQATLDEFAGWSVVPNPVPIWQDDYRPGEKGGAVTIAYTPSGKHEAYPPGHRLYWHGKGYDTTMRVLDRLAARHGVEVIAVRDRQISHAEALAAKRCAHIVIDECVTGSYHRNSLEGLSCGAVVVNGVGLLPGVEDVLRRCAGDAPDLPFVQARLDTLEKVLDGLIASGPVALEEAGRRNRTWMEVHWSFAAQWPRYWAPVVEAARARALPTRAATPPPRVSVIVPHGGADRLPLLATTLPRVALLPGVAELIVAELGPEPTAADTARAAGALYLFLYGDGPFNKSRALNAGSALARADAVLWLDGDLLLPPDFVTAAVAELDRRGLDCLLPWGSVHYLSQHNSAAVATGHDPARCAPANVHRTREGAPGMAVLVRTAFLRAQGGMDEIFRGWGGEDNAWFHKARVLGRAAATARGDVVIHHLHHAGSNGYGRAADGNPHYADNVARLGAQRRVTDPARYRALFPPPPPPCLLAAPICIFAQPGTAWAETLLPELAHALRALGLMLVDSPAPALRVGLGATAIEADVIVTESPGPSGPMLELRTSQHPPWTCRTGDPALLARTLLAPLGLLDAPRRPPPPSTANTIRALVVAAGGVGDIIRMTPFLRVLASRGARVDFAIAPHYPGLAALFQGAPEIARVIELPPAPRGAAPRCAALEAGPSYDLAVLHALAEPLRPSLRAAAVYGFDRARWRALGENAERTRLAASLGWTDALPPPVLRPSNRRFDLPSGTVALHAGCKRDWSFKRWHGFADLAARLRHVVVVGTAEDEANEGTYFRRRFAWPVHVRSFVGQLDLSDTAALLSQCAVLVSNDSGLMHMTAALGVPTFGIFGLTSPAREAMGVPNMHAVTKGLSCEPACHAEPAGRRDCAHHLRCLKELSVDEVLDRLRPLAPLRPPVPERVTGAVRLSGGLGDVVRWAPLLEALFRALGHQPLDVFHQDPAAAGFVFHGARWVRAVHPAAAFRPGQHDVIATIAQFVRYEVRDWAKLDRACPDAAERLRAAAARLTEYHGLHDRQPNLDGFWARLSVREGRSAAANVSHLGGLETPALPALFPDPEVWARVRGLSPLLDGPYVTVHDGFDNAIRVAPGQATKCWPLEHWAALVAGLKAAYPGVAVVQLGGTRSRAIRGVDVNLVQRTSLSEAAWVLKHALLHVDGDSGLVHLAHALHTRAVVLFGPTDAEFYGHPENRNLTAGACGGCWWATPDWLSRCPRGLSMPACMAAITPEQVLATAIPLLVPRHTAATLAARALYATVPSADAAGPLAVLFADAALFAVPITRHATNAEAGTYLHASKQWEYLFGLRHLPGGTTSLRIADVGAGRGALASHLAARGHTVDVFDRDYLWDHGGDLDIERRYAAFAAARGATVRFGSVHALPMPDESYDVVLCISVVEHLRGKALVLRELLRVLRPGGTLVLTFDYAPDPQRLQDGLRVEIFGPASLDATLAELGLQSAAFSHVETAESLAAIARDGVAGIPSGMTVGGLVIRKAVTSGLAPAPLPDGG